MAVTLGLIVAFGAGLLAVARIGDGPVMRRRIAIAIGFGVLLAVRLAVAGRYDGVSDGEVREYQELTAGVVAGDCCFGDRPMGYPMVLALATNLLGAGQLPVVALNLLFAVASGALVLGLSGRLYGAGSGPWRCSCMRAGRRALMVVTTLPHTAYELMVLLAAWSALATRPGWRGSALTGIVLGLSQYLRPSTPILIPAYLVARLWPGHDRAPSAHRYRHPHRRGLPGGAPARRGPQPPDARGSQHQHLVLRRAGDVRGHGPAQ